MFERMGLFGTVAARSSVARHLQADGQFMAIHNSGNLTFVMSGFGKDGNLIPFVLGDVCVFHSGQL